MGKGVALAVGGGLLLFFLGRRKGVSSSSRPTDVQLTPHFWRSEFLRSRTVPEVARYTPTEEETGMLRRWASLVGEPLRAKFGPVLVTGGARPDAVRDARGRTFTEALRAAGYSPSDGSDHRWFGAADIQFPKLAANQYQAAFEAAIANPNVRQVILEIEQGKPTIHVAVVAPGKPPKQDPDRAFMIVDGKRVNITGGGSNV